MMPDPKRKRHDHSDQALWSDSDSDSDYKEDEDGDDDAERTIVSKNNESKEIQRVRHVRYQEIAVKMATVFRYTILPQGVRQLPSHHKLRTKKVYNSSDGCGSVWRTLLERLERFDAEDTFGIWNNTFRIQFSICVLLRSGVKKTMSAAEIHNSGLPAIIRDFFAEVCNACVGINALSFTLSDSQNLDALSARGVEIMPYKDTDDHLKGVCS
jgi:hypothetical protein